MQWLSMIHIPLILNGVSRLLPASSINCMSYFVIGFIFQFLVLRKYPHWYYKYNYVLLAALSAGVGFTSVFVFFAITNNNISLQWWGSHSDNCPLATCPVKSGLTFGTTTQRGVECPIFP